MLDTTDIIVHLDDVQYPTARDWVNRNRIRSAKQQGWEWVSLSIQHDNRPEKLIMETLLADKNIWLPDMLRKINRQYARAPFYTPYAEEFCGLLGLDYQSIADLNIAIIQWIVDTLGIRVKVLRSSNLPCDGVKDDKLINIIKEVGGVNYLANNGSKPYIRPDYFRASGIAFAFQEYEHPDYPEFELTQMPPLSVIDPLFSLGPERTLEIVRSGKPAGRRFTLQQRGDGS